MNYKFHIKTGKLFLTMFFSYLLFLIVPVIIFFSMYYYSMLDYYETEISNSNLSRQYVLQKTIDGIFNELVRTALKISADKNLDTLYYFSSTGGHLALEDLLKIMTACNMLDDIKNINQNIQSIYVYNKDKNTVLYSGSGIVDKSNFSDSEIFEEAYKDKDSQISIVSRIPILPTVSTGDKTLPSGSSQPVVSLIYPISTYTSKVNGVIVINTNESALYNYINPQKTGFEGVTFITDRNGSLLLYDKNKMNGLNEADIRNVSKIIRERNEDGYFIATLGKQQYMVTYALSDSTGLVYAGVSSINNLFKKTYVYKATVTMVSVILFILGILLSYFISNKIYSPIKNIIASLRNEKQLTGAGYKNELQMITDSINHIIVERKRLSADLERNGEDLKQLYLLKLIDGNLEDSEYRFQFDYPDFLCMVISIDRYYEFSTCYTHDEQYYLKLFILKACEKIIGAHARVYGAVMQRDKLVVVINSEREDAAKLQMFITRILDAIRKELITDQGISMSFGIGNCYKGTENIKFSYIEALDAVRYKLIYGYGSVIYHSMISKPAKDDYYYPLDRENIIMNYLRANKIEEITKEVTGLMEDIKSRKDISYENIMQTLYQLVGSTIKTLMSSDVNITDIFKGHNNVYIELSEKEVVSDIQEWLLWFYRKIIDYTGNEDRVYKKHIKSVVDYIRNNYRNSNIDINTICEATNLSYPHLRKIFKDSIGVNVTDYIHKLRVGQAKKLLQVTGSTIRDIAESVGYNSDIHFTRCFKKFEGVTPGEYREKFKNN